MTNVDQFESVFRAAAKPVFHRRAVEFKTVLVVTDRLEASGSEFTDRVKGFLSDLDGVDGLEWNRVTGDEYGTSGELLAVVEKHDPSLIVSYRNLHSDGWKWPHSLGEYLDLLTQVASAPVLVCPHPEAGYASGHSMKATDRVMAVTDHLAGDERLVNHALAFAASGGTLYLSHIEDKRTFDRYVDVISKIPSIDTDDAQEAIREQLLKEPQDYIASIREAIHRDGTKVSIAQHVLMGHQLSEYKRLIEKDRISLLVLNTRDQDQLAMHGLAYPLAVELREIPMLML